MGFSLCPQATHCKPWVLTRDAAVAKNVTMNRISFALALAVAAALAGCDKQDHTITSGDPADPMAAELAKAPPVQLPPAILASKTYRCKDNSIVYVDFLNDNKTAAVRSTSDGTPTLLIMVEAGKPYIADGYSLTGAATGSSVTLTRPGKGSQSCKA